MQKNASISPLPSGKIPDKTSTTAHANECDKRRKRRVKRVEREQFRQSLKDPDTYACFWQHPLF